MVQQIEVKEPCKKQKGHDINTRAEIVITNENSAKRTRQEQTEQTNHAARDTVRFINWNSAMLTTTLGRITRKNTLGEKRKILIR